MNKKLFEKIKSYVENEYKNSGEWYLSYKNHVLLVYKVAIKLANKLKANKDVIKVAALFHDIAVMKFGKENHEIKSAEIAEDVLLKFNLDRSFIEEVKKCIIEHRHSKDIIPSSLESKIIRDADAISVIMNPLWFLIVFLERTNYNFREAFQMLKNRTDELYNSLILDESKKLAKRYYKNFLKIFKNLELSTS
ncbi:MAG: HD domain-containing protein [Candidatus Aenigmatarchaeota archaeon]